jgi:mitochondrial import inner membrane translocase subunit TIM16
MAIGPIARLLAQLIVPVVSVMARIIPTAYAEALQNAKKAGTTAENVVRKAISKQEALQILNLSEEEATAEAIERQFEKYMKANEVQKNTGSFYLQSKVYRAHEMLKEFQKEKQREMAAAASDQKKSSSDS